MPTFEPSSDEPRLESWKEIAAYLDRNVRTAKRWEEREALPVHRHRHRSRSSVYAYPREIDLWREGRKPARSSTGASAPRTSRRSRLALAAALVASLVSAGGRVMPLQGNALASANTPTLHCETCADFLGSVSRDGTMMAVVTPLASVDIGIHDIATGHVTPLRVQDAAQPAGEIVAPVFSPDGHRLAYTWVSKEADRVELRVTAREVGAEQATVVSNPEFNYLEPVGWATNETIVVLLRRPDLTWEIGTVETVGGAVTPVRTLDWRIPNALHAARVSPSGTHVAYSAFASNPDRPRTPQQSRGLERQIYVLALDGESDEVAVTTGAGFKDNPVWLPDGSSILYTSDVTGATDLWAQPLEELRPVGRPRIVRKEIGGVAALGMSSAGVLHYYLGRRGAVWTEFAALDDAGTAQYAPFVGRWPTWSPDGRYVAAGRPRTDGNGLDVVVRELATGAERTFDVPALRPMPFDWLPDSGRLLVAVAATVPADDTGFAPVPFRILDLTTKGLAVVEGTDSPSEPRAPNVRALSPTGKVLYQAAFRGSSGLDRVVAVDIESGESTLVFTLPLAETNLPRSAQQFAMTVSPDGRHLAVAVVDRELGAARIATVGVDGRNFREVAAIQAVNVRNRLAWTPDNRWILAASGGENGDPYRVVRIPAAGGEAADTGIEISRLAAMSMSPDGGTLAYSTLDMNGVAEQLWSLDVAALLAGR